MPHVESLVFNRSIYILIKTRFQSYSISLWALMCTFIFIFTVNISQCSQCYRQHTGREAILRARANILSAGECVAEWRGGGDCGQSKHCLALWLYPKMFFCVCVRGRCTILYYSRPHTPEVAPRLLCLFLATEQTQCEVKGGVQEQGQQEVKI